MKNYRNEVLTETGATIANDMNLERNPKTGDWSDPNISVMVYERSTYDGTQLYFCHYGNTPKANLSIEDEVFTDTSCFLEQIQEAILSGNQIFIESLLEEELEILEPDSMFWQELYFSHLNLV